MSSACEVLLVSGSLRRGSTNTALLRTAQRVAPPGVAAVLYDGQERLPHFDPDHDHDPLPPAVTELRRAIHASDAILFCTPEYAGALPGSFKNLLDWTIGDDRAGSIYDKPVAWVNASASPTGAADAHESLRKVLHFAHATVVEEACASIPVTRQAVGDDGLVEGPRVRARLARVLSALVAAAGCAGGEEDRGGRGGRPVTGRPTRRRSSPNQGRTRARPPVAGATVGSGERGRNP